MKKLLYILCVLFCIQTHQSQAKTIHIFGDGHVLYCFANDNLETSYTTMYHNSPLFFTTIHWLGPKTIAKLGNETLQEFNIKQPKELDIVNGNVITKIGTLVEENDIVIFALGEIDVRNHIGKQRDTEQKDLNELLDILVSHYMRTIHLNLAQFNHIDCIIMEVIPPVDKTKCKDSLPFYGSIQDRINITRTLNSKLKNACLAHNYIFLPTHDLYALPDGSLNPDLSDHVVHVAFKHNYLIRERLIKTVIDKEIL